MCIGRYIHVSEASESLLLAWFRYKKVHVGMLGGKVPAPTPTYLLGGSCRRYDFIYSAHDWSSFRETSQSHTLNPFGHNQSTNRLLHLLILSSMYSMRRGTDGSFL